MTYRTQGVQPAHLVLYDRGQRETFRGRAGTVPSCFSLQHLSLPGVMYFTSLVRFPSGVDPRMSVRRPGIELDNGGANLDATNAARGPKLLTRTASRLLEPPTISSKHRTRVQRVQQRRWR